MSKKRRREQPAIDVQLVEIYEDLANVDENIRLRAAQALLTNFVADGKSTGEQLNEIVRRLLRGLCSGRKAARLGFSVVLTELLTELLGPSGRGAAGFQNVLELTETLKKQSHVSGSVSGQVCGSEMSPLLLLNVICTGRARLPIWTALWRRIYHQVRNPVPAEHWGRTLV